MRHHAYSKLAWYITTFTYLNSSSLWATTGLTVGKQSRFAAFVSSVLNVQGKSGWMQFAAGSITINKCSYLKLDVATTKTDTHIEVIFTLYYLPFSFSRRYHTKNNRFFVVVFPGSLTCEVSKQFLSWKARRIWCHEEHATSAAQQFTAISTSTRCILQHYVIPQYYVRILS